MRDVGDHSTHFSEGKTEAQGAVRDMPSIPLFQCWPSPAFSPTGHFGLREVVKAAHPYQAVTVDTAWDLCAEDRSFIIWSQFTSNPIFQHSLLFGLIVKETTNKSHGLIVLGLH